LQYRNSSAYWWIPIAYRLRSGGEIISIFSSVDEFRQKYRKTIEYLTYGYDNGRQFVIYCWNIFSTIMFVQECLKRFGEKGDQFVLTWFELQDGIFKKFIAMARKNYEDSLKSKEDIEKEVSVQQAMTDFFSNIELGIDKFKTINGSEFTITSVDDRHINIYIPGNPTVNKLNLNIDEVRKMLESGEKFEKIKDIMIFFGKTYSTQGYSYDYAIYKAISERKIASSKSIMKQTELKKYIFIIDEINRGEISKIFGELFFAIDPGYRGKVGEISTQYANMHSDPDEKFYIPENVYIIGTMNDIDRSVDSFDFAMRRRFRFIELKADERLEMLATLEDDKLEAEAIRRMTALNMEIANVEDLNENYQIGASYFLKLNTLTFDQLWTDYLQPLLQEYIQGMYDEEGIMKKFAKAYGYLNSDEGSADEASQN
jgi:hypothetical protein